MKIKSFATNDYEATKAMEKLSKEIKKHLDNEGISPERIISISHSLIFNISTEKEGACHVASALVCYK
jgi:hypothetical protein